MNFPNLPVVDVEEPVEGEVKAQRNVDGSWIGGLKKITIS